MTLSATDVESLQSHGQDIPWLLGHWAEKRPDHPALIWDPPSGNGARQWTYAELKRDVWRLAAGLSQRGIAKGERVLVHADNSPEFVLAWLACSVAGAVGVTTNTRSVAEEVRFFIDKAECVAAITQPQYAELVAEAGPGLKWIAVTADDGGEAPSADPLAAGGEPFEGLFADDQFAGRPPEPMLPFGIMFTSGTTNRPKAVVHTHANAIWASRLGPRNIDLGADDRYLIYLPFFHVNAQSWSFFSVLGVGATTVLMPKWSTSRFWDVVERHEVTHISLMPFCIPALMGPDRRQTKLRVGVFGALMPDWDKQFGLAVYAAYGMTETVTHAINGKPSEPLLAGSMGRVANGYEIAVVDKETGALCGEGEVGELWLRGTRGIQLFLEYFDNPEANEAAFEDGWFKTGDMVMQGPGGNVFYRERDKDLLKVGGENVSAKQVEEIVARVPGVASVAVVGKEHEWLNQVVVAFVIKAAGAPDDATLEQQVIELCTASLADFKVPRAVYFVDQFPTGTLDKILKNRLREMADEQPAVK
ncbi:MAG TPA: AMP-binding protein [Acidimicrobiales bacterium]|jgi:crotonobetaine/carnitine-CoA ligase|nr:AMP-binding protein [Acidimicrobiales bacterium]